MSELIITNAGVERIKKVATEAGHPDVLCHQVFDENKLTRVLIRNPHSHKEMFIYIPSGESSKQQLEDVLSDNKGIYAYLDENDTIEM